MANEFIIKHGFHSKGNSAVTGSLGISGSVDVKIPNGSAFTVEESDYITGEAPRFDFKFTNGNPLLEITSRTTTGSLFLRQDYGGNGVKITSNGTISRTLSGVVYGFDLGSNLQPIDTSGLVSLGNFNRRWKDLYLFNGGKLSFGTNITQASGQKVNLIHTANTNTLQVSGSSDVILDVKGVVSASKFTANSGSSAALPGYSFHHSSGTGLYSQAAGYLQLQVNGGGSPELELTTGQATFRVPIQLTNNELINPSRIRGIGSITGSTTGNNLGVSASLDLDGDLSITGSLYVTGSISASGDLISNRLLLGGGTFTSASLAAGGGGGSSIDTGSLGNTVITGSLTASGSIVDFSSASSVLLPDSTVPLINPQVKYLTTTAITSSGTTVPLPGGLTFISSSTFEYLEVFINGLRLRYDIDFAPQSTSTVKYFTTLPVGTEVTYKSLNRP